jgi:DNA-binding NtrC family response regulator
MPVLTERRLRKNAKDTTMSDCVFVIEDDHDTRYLLGMIMSNAGCKAYLFSTLHEALDCLSSARPRVILMDYFVTGSEVSIQDFLIAARSICASKIMFLSGSIDIKSKAEQYRVDAYMTKPFLIDDLVKIVVALKNPVHHGV